MPAFLTKLVLKPSGPGDLSEGSALIMLSISCLVNGESIHCKPSWLFKRFGRSKSIPMKSVVPRRLLKAFHRRFAFWSCSEKFIPLSSVSDAIEFRLCFTVACAWKKSWTNIPLSNPFDRCPLFPIIFLNMEQFSNFGLHKISEVPFFNWQVPVFLNDVNKLN